MTEDMAKEIQYIYINHKMDFHNIFIRDVTDDRLRESWQSVSQGVKLHNWTGVRRLFVSLTE